MTSCESKKISPKNPQHLGKLVCKTLQVFRISEGVGLALGWLFHQCLGCCDRRHGRVPLGSLGASAIAQLAHLTDAANQLGEAKGVVNGWEQSEEKQNKIKMIDDLRGLPLSRGDG